MKQPKGVNLSKEHRKMLERFLEPETVREGYMAVADSLGELSRDCEKLATLCRETAADLESCSKVHEVFTASKKLCAAGLIEAMLAHFILHHTLFHHHEEAYDTFQEQLEKALPELVKTEDIVIKKIDEKRTEVLIMQLFG